MKHSRAVLAACVVAAAMCAPSIAYSQYSVTLSFSPTAPATCDANGVSQTGTGQETVILPNLPGNTYVSVSENGGPAQVFFQTIPGPFPVSFPAPGGVIIATSTALTPPYTIVETIFPAQNGAPVGVGVRATAVCGTLSASITFESVSAPSTAVPALSTPTLAVLAALLALAGAALLRRRRG